MCVCVCVCECVCDVYSKLLNEYACARVCVHVRVCERGVVND